MLTELSSLGYMAHPLFAKLKMDKARSSPLWNHNQSMHRVYKGEEQISITNEATRQTVL